MKESKSTYELMLDDIASKSTKVSFSDDQNFQIIEELNRGMKDFILEQRNIEKDTVGELRGICLNA